MTSARLPELAPGSGAGWAAYVLGVLWAMRDAGHDLTGLDILVDGSVPMGAGLSSSAALECAVAAAVDELCGAGFSAAELIAVARRSENEFVGAPTGALDQTASVLCQQGQALLVDFQDMSTRQVPFDLHGAGLSLLVIDTHAPHRHADGEYAARRADCAHAVSALEVTSLRQVADTDLPSALGRLEDPTLRSRVTHVVTENARVAQAAASLDVGDLRGIGPLLLASHVSLRDDYQVSCRELDIAVDAAMSAHALGARMTGGGFGGSAIALVERALADEVGEAVRRAFDRADLRAPTVFGVKASAGLHPLRDEGPSRGGAPEFSSP